jgi:ABC-2 type transport system permease protein
MITAKIETRSLVKGLIIWTLLFAVIIFGFSAVYPQMHSSAMKDLLDAKLTGLSPSLLKTFNISVEGQASFLVAAGFFAYYFQYMFLAASIYAMMLGSQSLIKEETDGTIEFLYAQPVTRKGIVTSKIAGNLLILSIFWLISYGVSVGSTLLYRQSTDSAATITKEISKIFIQESLILIFFLMLGFFISTFLKSSKQSTSVSLGIVFGFYLIGIFSDLNDSFSWAKNISPTHMGIPSNLLDKGLSVGHVGLLAVLIGLFLVGTYVLYQRKDLKI